MMVFKMCFSIFFKLTNFNKPTRQNRLLDVIFATEPVLLVDASDGAQFRTIDHSALTLLSQLRHAL